MGLSMPVRLESIEQYIIRQHHGFRHLELSEIQVLDRWAESITQEIEDAWPVDTSTSRDAFMYTLMSGGMVGFTLMNDVDYVEFIHAKGEPSLENGGVALIDSLIPEIIQANAPQMLQDLRDAVDSTELTYQVPVYVPRRKRAR